MTQYYWKSILAKVQIAFGSGLFFVELLSFWVPGLQLSPVIHAMVPFAFVMLYAGGMSVCESSELGEIVKQ